VQSRAPAAAKLLLRKVLCVRETERHTPVVERRCAVEYSLNS